MLLIKEKNKPNKTETMTTDKMSEIDIGKIKEILASHKDELKNRFKVREIGVFGSYVRGEQKEGSDIDLLVEFEKDADLFHLTGLSIFLEETLNHKVDVISQKSLREELKESIQREALYV
ncbi:MAG: nucleotidyltransferase family protein [Halobacteriota archaeon]|nr:nucleotidyltransferase family protein [Halobacteriota archaeon]